MAASFSAILLSLALLCFSASMAQEHTLLYLKWPGGMCQNAKDCCFPCTMTDPDDFKIDYLAKSNGDGTFPFCLTLPFRLRTVQSFAPRLYKGWPGMRCPADMGVFAWETAWDDNGVCTDFNQYDYFAKALALRDSANLLKLLQDKWIKPSSWWFYSKTSVVDAINEGLGAKTALIHCGSNKTSAIRTVRLCADKTATTFIDCPNPLPSTCPDSVQLLPARTSFSLRAAAEDAAAFVANSVRMVRN